MNINDILAQDDVLLDLNAQSKGGLLRDLAERSALRLGLTANKISSSLLNREKLGSTGVGGGIAIPHARIDAVLKPFGTMARLRQPVDFEAIDDKPVDLVFLLLLPQSGNDDSLAALALIARKLRNPKEVSRLRRARSVHDLFAALTS